MEDSTTQAAAPTQTSAAPATPVTDTATAAAPAAQPATQATTTEAAAPAEAAPAAPVVPERYEFVAPEGVTYDETVISSYSEAAKKAGLSQDQASTMLETMAPALAERTAAQIESAKQAWGEQTKADPEIGGDKLGETLSLCAKARDEFAPESLRKLLDDTGLGNHPEMVRMFAKLGRSMSEDRIVRGGKATAEPTTAQRMYPNMNP